MKNSTKFLVSGMLLFLISFGLMSFLPEETGKQPGWPQIPKKQNHGVAGGGWAAVSIHPI